MSLIENGIGLISVLAMFLSCFTPVTRSVVMMSILTVWILSLEIVHHKCPFVYVIMFTASLVGLCHQLQKFLTGFVSSCSILLYLVCILKFTTSLLCLYPQVKYFLTWLVSSSSLLPYSVLVLKFTTSLVDF